MKSLEAKVAEYMIQIKKLGDLSLLSEAKKAQEDAKAAAEKARDLYKKYIKSSKQD